MADPNARDAKLIQYLNEAYGKEKELEVALTAHIGMTTQPRYKKRLKQHLTETKEHGRQLERRIKKLGGQPTTVGQVAGEAIGRAKSLAKGPLHMARGTGEEEKLLKNAKTEYSEEAEEIATYTAIEALAENVGDKETAKIARGIRREEERMAKFLEGLIPQLTRAVAKAEIPAAERNGSSSSRRRTSRRTSSSSRSRNGSGGSSRRSTSRSSSSKSGRSRSTSGSGRRSKS
jgi:ferritin-like metal-binding protein YciE